MKRILLMSLFGFLGAVHAQSFDWNRVWSSCSAESNAFDADVRGTELSARKVQNFVQEALGSPPTEAKMRAKMAEDRAVLANPQYDVTTKLATRLALCGTMAAQRQLQAGSTQSASAPSNRISGRDRPDLMASRCLEFSNSRLRNNCTQKISANWCSDDYGTNGCGSKNLGWTEFAPGESIYLSAEKAYWFACAFPGRPYEVEYLPGQGLKAGCTQ